MTSGQLAALDDFNILPTPILEGIVALKSYLGEGGASLLQEVQPRPKELASFIFHLPSDYLGVERTLHIGFGADFPSTGLSLVVSPDPGLDWPHTMHGSLCLYGVGQAPPYGDSLGVVNQTMRRFSALMQLVVAGSDPNVRKAEYAQEITSYWSTQLDSLAQQLILLDEPSESCPLFVMSDMRWRPGFGEKYLWFAKEKSNLERYVSRLSGMNEKVKNPAQAAFYVRLTSTPEVRVPNSTNLLKWIAPHTSVQAKADLKRWLEDSDQYSLRWLFLQLPGKMVTIQSLVLKSTVLKKDAQVTYGKRSGRKNQHHGNKDALLAKLHSAHVHIISREAIHSRNPSYASRRLNTKRVLMVGVGSLGAKVTMELIKEGIEDITLVDPDFLADVNLGRHILGTDDLGRYKVTALEERIKRDMPLTKVKSTPFRIQEIVALKPQFLDKFDVVVITTADWWSEKFLWALKSSGTPWAVVQGWSEPYALSGHCLTSGNIPHADATHLFDIGGNFLHRFTDFPDGGIIPLEACGAGYIPGGPLGLSRIASMISSCVIDLLLNSEQEPKWHYSVSNIEQVAGFGGKYHGPSLPEGITFYTQSKSWPKKE